MIEFEKSFKELVEQYFEGFIYNPGENAPRLSRQLDKQGVEYTEDENKAFSELLKVVYTEVGKDTAISFQFTNILPTYDEQDDWAFDGSCHREGGEGQFTSEILQTLDEARYCYIYDGIEPLARFYYLEQGEDLGVSDLYSQEGHGFYLAPRLLLCLAYNKRFSDFYKLAYSLVDSPYGNSHGYWSNLSANGYTHYSTNPDWQTLHIYDDDFEGVLTEYGFHWSNNLEDFVNPEFDDIVWCENIEDYENIDSVQTCEHCQEAFSESGDYICVGDFDYCSSECAIAEGCLLFDYEWHAPFEWGVCEECGDYILNGKDELCEDCKEELEND